MKTIQSDDVTIMQLRHEDEEVGLCARIFSNNLVHAHQRWHAWLGLSQRVGSKLRSVANGIDVQMTILRWPFM